MGGRYLISGAQLGTLLALSVIDSRKCNDEIKKIIELQFLGNSDETIKFDMVRLSVLFKND